MRSVPIRDRLFSQASIVPLRLAFPGIDLAHQIDLVAASTDRLADDRLGAAFGIHLGGVDQRHTKIETGAQALDLALGLETFFARCWMPASTGTSVPSRIVSVGIGSSCMVGLVMLAVCGLHHR